MTTSGSCPACSASVHPTDQFCESCGAPLTADAAANSEATGAPGEAAPKEPGEVAPGAPGEVAPRAQRAPCAACGGEVDENRWCTVCGLRAPSERDQWIEQPAPWVAGMCDRGKRHVRNEDAMAIAANAEPGSFCALVVCDGVTTAAASDVASLAACKAALEVLLTDRPADTVSGALDDEPEDSPAGAVVRWTTVIEQASRAANDAATAVAATVPADAEPPSCTFVAAVLDGSFVVTGWVGDSRAYWLPDNGAPLQLTVDDSWAADQMALGMSREAAEADSRAHSITRWLGADSGGAVARCSSTPVDGPGWVLTCSDGLWNYCSAATDLRALVNELVSSHGEDPAKIADALVSFANAAGGHDNITVALARVPAE